MLYRIFIELRAPFLEGKLYWLLATNYAMAVPVAAALYQMNRLLSNISRDEVFVAENTRCLRILFLVLSGGRSDFWYQRLLLHSVLGFVCGSPLSWRWFFG